MNKIDYTYESLNKLLQVCLTEDLRGDYLNKLTMYMVNLNFKPLDNSELIIKKQENKFYVLFKQRNIGLYVSTEKITKKGYVIGDCYYFCYLVTFDDFIGSFITYLDKDCNLLQKNIVAEEINYTTFYNVKENKRFSIGNVVNTYYIETEPILIDKYSKNETDLNDMINIFSYQNSDAIRPFYIKGDNLDIIKYNKLIKIKDFDKFADSLIPIATIRYIRHIIRQEFNSL